LIGASPKFRTQLLEEWTLAQLVREVGQPLEKPAALLAAGNHGGVRELPGRDGSKLCACGAEVLPESADEHGGNDDGEWCKEKRIRNRIEVFGSVPIRDEGPDDMLKADDRESNYAPQGTEASSEATDRQSRSDDERGQQQCHRDASDGAKADPDDKEEMIDKEEISVGPEFQADGGSDAQNGNCHKGEGTRFGEP
jgi:hypothetical protein